MTAARRAMSRGRPRVASSAVPPLSRCAAGVIVEPYPPKQVWPIHFAGSLHQPVHDGGSDHDLVVASLVAPAPFCFIHGVVGVGNQPAKRLVGMIRNDS